ncbi:MAG: hypothetical protein ACO22J_04130, partial [Burkholderiaceae bacterium]
VTGEGSGRAADETVALIAERGGEAVPNYGNVTQPVDPMWSLRVVSQLFSWTRPWSMAFMQWEPWWPSRPTAACPSPGHWIGFV